jgi:hypothetical protein
VVRKGVGLLMLRLLLLLLLLLLLRQSLMRPGLCIADRSDLNRLRRIFLLLRQLFVLRR